MIDYDGLNRLAYQIKTETSRAANTALRVGILFEDIIAALIEGDNTGLLDQITNLKNDISKILNMIKDLNTEIDTSIINRIEANERNISDINSTVSNIQGDINTINGTLSNHTSLITGLQGQITTVNNSIGAINTQLTNITNTISGITSDLTALTVKVNTNITDIAELKRRLDAIDLAPIIAAIEKLKVDLNALTNRVSTIEVEIEGIRTGMNNISNNLALEINRAEAAEEAITADLTGHISNVVMHTTQGEKDKLSNLADDAEATYAKKIDLTKYLPLAGGKMTGDIKFTGVPGSGTLIFEGNRGFSRSCMAATRLTDSPEILINCIGGENSEIQFGFYKVQSLKINKNGLFRDTANAANSYTVLDEGNSVYVVSAYPTELSSYPDGAIFIKTS